MLENDSSERNEAARQLPTGGVGVKKPLEDSTSMRRDMQFHSGRLSRETPLSKDEPYGVETPESSKGHEQSTSMQFR